jgi:hypothetical protein
MKDNLCSEDDGQDMLFSDTKNAHSGKMHWLHNDMMIRGGKRKQDAPG